MHPSIVDSYSTVIRQLFDSYSIHTGKTEEHLSENEAIKNGATPGPEGVQSDVGTNMRHDSNCSGTLKNVSCQLLINTGVGKIYLPYKIYFVFLHIRQNYVLP